MVSVASAGVRDVELRDVDLNDVNRVWVAPNEVITASVRAEADNDDPWRSTKYLIQGGSWICVDTGNHYSGTHWEDFPITAPSTPGAYDFSVKVYQNENCDNHEDSGYLWHGIIVVAPTAVCGNNDVESGESCDGEDGCLNDCTWDNIDPVITIDPTPDYQSCGDGFVTICADIVDDSSLKTITLACSSSTGWNAGGPMSLVSGNRYCEEVSVLSLHVVDGTTVDCSVSAVDIKTNSASENAEQITFDCAYPSGDFTCNPLNGDENLEVSCNAGFTDVSPLTYAWSFVGGDTTSSTDEDPSGIWYMNNGLYDVKLTVTDAVNNVVVIPKANYITVNDVLPVPDFTYAPTPVKEGVSVSFTDGSTSHDQIISWSWNFGDGNSDSGTSVSHVYADNGAYDVTLTVCDNENCVPIAKSVTVDNVAPAVTIDGETSCNEGTSITLSVDATDVDEDTISYIWSHSASTSSTASYDCVDGDSTPSVTVTVSDEDSGETIVTYDITIANVAPVANANGPYDAAVGVEVCFDGSATDDGVEDTHEFEWDFDYESSFDNDGSGSPVCTTYSSTGEYTIALIADDGEDESEIVTSTVTVYEYGIPLAVGWNLISIPVASDDSSIDAVFGGIINSIAYVDDSTATILQYNAVEDKWYKSRPDGSVFAWSSSNSKITSIVPGNGYWVKMDESAVLYGNEAGLVQQSLPSSSVEVASQSWNLVGKYELAPTSITPAKAFESLENQFFSGSLRGYDKAAESLVYRNMLETGQGYWIYTTNFADNEDTWSYTPITYIN